MKKTVISFLISFLIFASLTLVASCAEIVLFAPSESEIAPTRDFYVVGKIDRKGQSAASMPLNVKIELIDASGKVVRLLESNVGARGTTPAEYYLLDYEQGSAVNDSNGKGLNLFTPPDIIFDGNDRNSIRSMNNKIVVKEDYFAAVIYGGATKAYELDYVDENQKPLADIAKGNYILRITATDLNGQEVCASETKLTFGVDKGRVIASDNKLIADYADENNLTVTNSVAGLWAPSSYFPASKDFSYMISKRFNENIALEYKSAKDVSILLYNLDLSDETLINMLGAVYEVPTNKTYLYYDIGEKQISFTFNGSVLTKEGTIISTKEDSFIKILRSETVSGDNTYLDFVSDDGFVLTKDNPSAFYGVYSPKIENSAIDSDTFNPVDKVAFIKYTLINSKGETVHEGFTNPYFAKGEENTPARYEFSFEINPDSKLTKTDAVSMVLSLCDADKEVIFTEKPMAVKINPKGDFIGNYDDSYWGKSFCDAINALGKTPQDEFLEPDEFITRGNFATMINRLFGYSISSEKAFADLSEESIYFSDCSTAQAAGYMTGDEHGRVKADELISREQAMIILARISKAEPGENNVIFNDSDKVSFWAKDYVDVMTSNGIVSGFEGYLHPTDNITVAEATALVIKTFKWMHQGEIINSDIKTENSGSSVTDTGIADMEFMERVNFDTVSAFIKANSDTLTALANHFSQSYENGIYISRVGNGLEIRDYLLGNYIALPEDVLKTTTTLSRKFAEFSIRYNPKSENAVHFILGRNEAGKQVGLTFTAMKEVKNKTLTHIEGNWYYYIQK
ncbi:MAG: S-layer homology domain-containing protein [Clostridia bacterium]|nr:S-layer homology domain-containing protein [Clostridia bacterium]